MNLLIAFAATLFERIFGYPRFLMPLVSHPVVWMGKAIQWAEKRLNGLHWPAPRRRLSGVLVLVALSAITVGLAATISALLANVPFGWLFEAVLASSLIAQRHLAGAVAAVGAGLAVSIGQGRKAVSQIVGRDTAGLNEDGVVRGALESLAENTSDGIIAPVLFLALFGLPGIALYKLVNTADSMIGHKNARYGEFGWAAARLDDLLNIVPARLTAFLFAMAAGLGNTGGERAWKAARRDAPRHRSPNAGWPEAALAGALDISLGGPRDYAGVRNELAYMGNGRKTLNRADIAPGLKLYWRALNLMSAGLAVAVGVWFLL
jgi:adenosylcobinamide-phosphate synthase